MADNENNQSKKTNTTRSRSKKKTSSKSLPAGTQRKAVKFVAGKSDNKSAADASSVGAMTDYLRENLALKHREKVLDQQKQILAKSVKPMTVRKDLKQKNDRNKIAFNAEDWSENYEGVETKSWRRLSDIEQKELAQVDPYLSAIISTRCSQGSVCGRPSDSKFDKGTRLMELQPLRLEDFQSKDEYEKAQRVRSAQIKFIMDWFFTCGTTDKDTLNAAYAGTDDYFKKCILPDFISAQIRNLLTFGRAHIQKFRNEDGAIIMFRPAPTETIFNLRNGYEAHMAHSDDTTDQSLEDAKEYNEIRDEEERPPAFVQRIDGRNVNFFTEDDMECLYFQKQALFDMNGYPLSPIEQAIYMVFTHQQTLGYLRNHFVKGLGNKGILTLESSDPAADLSDEDLEQLRRDFHNFVNRNDNSAATPVISGPVKVNYIPLSPSPRDMEFLQVEEHVVRALCSALQISPQEMGYGHLSIGQGGMTQANKQEEIIRGEERGLRMLLDIIYDGLNDILYENFPEAKELFRLTYVGVGEDTRDAVTQRHQQELNTTATMSSLWADSEKTDTIPYGGQVPLSPNFHQSVVKYMKYGRFMEEFFGEKGWSEKPEYDFLIDPNLNQSYQQLKVQPLPMQQEGAAIALKEQEMELQSMAQQQQMAEQQAMQPQPGQEGEQPQGEEQPQEAQEGAAQDEGQPMEGTQKSLRDEYHNRKKLAKSMRYYFQEWMHAHDQTDD